MPAVMRRQVSTRKRFASQTVEEIHVNELSFPLKNHWRTSKKQKRRPAACVTLQIEWALQRGGRSAHPFSWLLSSPQQPLETEDPPTVSLAPQYTSQRLCRAIEFFGPAKAQKIRRFCAGVPKDSWNYERLSLTTV